ncbi:MAG: Lrp/AsnC family transcriptional regulator [Geminicoccaceae bacterium]|nr:Lrp/AsnC family transcriptional regulator [Geminicoccaceae bacterium]MCB9966169.1 Lrp/AsnC family transcriptional regulator [Geminicoccaceae bacterium]HRY26484.1 Lrp/AsnC family transcriptional regulator [Geminicoccaceae bacterium]
MRSGREPGDAATLERRLVQAIGTGLPLVPDPYAEVAAALGTDEATVIATLEAMLARGAIRRIGAVPNHYALGYRANGMAVFDVDDAMVAELGPLIGAFDFVSHCYRRPRHPPLWPYNLFAMVHAKTRPAVETRVRQIRSRLGSACRGDTILYSRRILKKTGLRLAR